MPLWIVEAFWSTVIVTLNNHDMCIVMCLTSFQSNRHAISIATCRTQFYGKQNKLRMLSRWICEYPLLFNPLLLSYDICIYIYMYNVYVYVCVYVYIYVYMYIYIYIYILLLLLLLLLLYILGSLCLLLITPARSEAGRGSKLT